MEYIKHLHKGVDVGYMIPYPAIIISIVFVFIIVGITMKYSLDKINKAKYYRNNKER